MPETAKGSGVILRQATGADIERIKPLWEAVYQHQSEHGMLLSLPDGAYEAWVKSITPFLGRFANVVVAEESETIIGFVAGRIRTLPPYFGSATVGAISEVFICESR